MDAVSQIVIGGGTLVVLHPIAYAKVLIQLGHEPVPAKLSTNLFGNKVLMYPNIFKYIGHIKETDGFLGLYRGLYFRLVSTFINNYATGRVYAALTEPLTSEAAEAESPSTVSKPETTESKDSVGKLFRDTMNEALSHSVGIVISQPFHVIFIRSVSQFVGREEQYSTLLSSFSDIWTNEGLKGFFAGLVPRLIGEVVTICLTNLLTYIINNWIFDTRPSQDKEMRGYSGTVASLLVTQMTYPFTVVANVMAVNGCSGLAIGRATNYSSWMACCSSLAAANELKRGSSMFWRQYRPPVTTRGGGKAVAE